MPSASSTNLVIVMSSLVSFKLPKATVLVTSKFPALSSFTPEPVPKPSEISLGKSLKGVVSKVFSNPT